MSETTNLDTTRRHAKRNRGFTVGEFKFRTLSTDDAETLESFGYGFFLGLGDAPEGIEQDTRQLMDILLTVAWMLWADPELVIDLSLDFDEATSKTAKAKCRRELRKRVRLFAIKTTDQEKAQIFEHLNAAFEEIAAVDFDVVDSADAPEDSADPPPNY